jgi:hypothetical protein
MTDFEERTDFEEGLRLMTVYKYKRFPLLKFVAWLNLLNTPGRDTLKWANTPIIKYALGQHAWDYWSEASRFKCSCGKFSSDSKVSADAHTWGNDINKHRIEENIELYSWINERINNK